MIFPPPPGGDGKYIPLPTRDVNVIHFVLSYIVLAYRLVLPRREVQARQNETKGFVPWVGWHKTGDKGFNSSKEQD